MFKNIKAALSKIHPAKAMLLGYFIYALLGWFVLMMPICHVEHVSHTDNLFTAISALSTTGLSTVNLVKDYSVVGQVVMLVLIQIGGIGFMTFNTFVVLATLHKISHLRKKVASTEVSLPKDFVISEFISHVIIYTLACELIGAVILSLIFMDYGIENPIWNGVFHSIAAFCTAGFSLFPDNLVSFKYDLGINLTISFLSILGALGFIVWMDFYKKFTGKTKHLRFITKVILGATFCFISIGTLLFFLSEEPFTQGSIYDKVIISFFQVVTASTTTGFNTVDIGILQPAVIVLLFILMAFGAAPAGTGGGLKNTTFVTLIGLVKSSLTGQNIVTFWGRQIPPKRVQLATTIFSYYAFTLTFFIFLLVTVEDKPFLPLLFEAASAIGTVGLTMDVTPNLTELGKILISILMFMGKMSILTFGIALVSQTNEKIAPKKIEEFVF
ncbi:MAG: potassium transporter KtrB [Chlamydiae bacterium]|nr:potassium transporter KtrB [Chlamydiota bacterium]